MSGGIAAYKSADLVRRLKERDFIVRVVMTEASTHFITPMTMQAVSANPVHLDLFDQEAEAAMGHIELAKWADIILVAPATANTIAKINQGLADNLLTTLVLASKAQLVIAPAMNQQMWTNTTTISNVEGLRQKGTLVFGPDAGEQACGDVGAGRMMEPLMIADEMLRLSATSFERQELRENKLILNGLNVMITAGPTVEAIDPVRFISNHSSGKMGYALAEVASDLGAMVTLVSGPVNLCAPNGVSVKPVTSAKEMMATVQQHIGNCELFIGCAAVADYTPIKVAKHKIKKNEENMNVELVKNPDIISWVAAQKQRPIVVGFAAESQNLSEFAINKLSKKKLDLICANNISQEELGFNSENNEIFILDKSGKEVHLPAASKSNIAKSILEHIYQQFLIK